MLIVPYQWYIYFSFFCFTTFTLWYLCCAISHVGNEFCFLSARGWLNCYKACALLRPKQLNLVWMPQSICDYDIQTKQSHAPCSQKPATWSCEGLRDGTEANPKQFRNTMLSSVVFCWVFPPQKNAEWADREKNLQLLSFLAGKYLAIWEMEIVTVRRTMLCQILIWILYCKALCHLPKLPPSKSELVAVSFNWWLPLG